MVHPAQGRAVALLIAFIIWGLWPYRLQILLPAEMFIIAREVYRITRTSGVLKYKKVQARCTSRSQLRSDAEPGFYHRKKWLQPTIKLIFSLYQKKMKGATNTKDILSEFIANYLLPPDSFIERAICIYKSFLKLVLLNNGDKTIRLIIFLHALKDIVHAFVELPLIMMVAFFGASIIPKIYKDNQKTIDLLLARCSENIEKFKKWHDARFPREIPVAAEEKKDE
ncbi:hypothetical protein CAEBREN_14029 [Caenorhabditis brenneri]|uniref:Reticulon-like protein n=1 Tax=Caenorhabditis brenneri TaxID=135651 RepID=G0MQ38_CAEBE|nr:hypothetical protein CAEBREN_14029 [Caenorhabditis brenneri]